MKCFSGQAQGGGSCPGCSTLVASRRRQRRCVRLQGVQFLNLPRGGIETQSGSLGSMRKKPWSQSWGAPLGAEQEGLGTLVAPAAIRSDSHNHSLIVALSSPNTTPSPYPQATPHHGPLHNSEPSPIAAHLGSPPVTGLSLHHPLAPLHMTPHQGISPSLLHPSHPLLPFPTLPTSKHSAPPPSSLCAKRKQDAWMGQTPKAFLKTNSSVRAGAGEGASSSRPQSRSPGRPPVPWP